MDRVMRDAYEAKVDAFEEAYEDEVMAMEPGSWAEPEESEEPVYPYGSFPGEI